MVAIATLVAAMIPPVNGLAAPDIACSTTSKTTTSRSRRQLRSGLLCHHVGGVPGGPVRVPLAGPRLVLAVRSLGAPQGLRQVIRRGIGRVARHAPREPCGDLLQQPAVAVRVAERRVRAVAEVVRRDAADLAAEGTGRGGVMEYLAHLDAAPHQLVARSLDVGDDQEQALGGSRLGVLSEVNRALGARRRELDRAVVAVAEVGVEPPPETSIELLRAVDIRDRD